RTRQDRRSECQPCGIHVVPEGNSQAHPRGCHLSTRQGVAIRLAEKMISADPVRVGGDSVPNGRPKKSSRTLPHIAHFARFNRAASCRDNEKLSDRRSRASTADHEAFAATLPQSDFVGSAAAGILHAFGVTEAAAQNRRNTQGFDIGAPSPGFDEAQISSSSI